MKSFLVIAGVSLLTMYCHGLKKMSAIRQHMLLAAKRARFYGEVEQ